MYLNDEYDDSLSLFTYFNNLNLVIELKNAPVYDSLKNFDVYILA